MEPKKKSKKKSKNQGPYFKKCTKTLIKLKKTKKFLPNPKKTLLTFYNPPVSTFYNPSVSTLLQPT